MRKKLEVKSVRFYPSMTIESLFKHGLTSKQVKFINLCGQAHSAGANRCYWWVIIIYTYDHNLNAPRAKWR